MDLTSGISLLQQLPAGAGAIQNDLTLAHYLSSFALRFASEMDGYVPDDASQPDFWLFLPFATAPDFPQVPADQVRRLALASTCMIIYNILFDAAVDDPGRPDINTQVLAEYALTCMHEHLYRLFPAGSLFWDHFTPMYARFLSSMIDERAHKGRPQPYSYEEYDRISRQKMSMVLMNPIGLAVMGQVPEHIPTLLSAWDEMNVAVVILDDIKDWEKDYEEENFTYLLAEALGLNDGCTSLPESVDSLVSQVIFSGTMEDLYRRGAAHLDRTTSLAHQASAPALAQLAEERAQMFRKFAQQLMLRKLEGLREHLSRKV